MRKISGCNTASLIFIGLLSSGCAMVSSHNNWFADDPDMRRLGAGTYNLAKHVLSITVHKDPEIDYSVSIVRRTIRDPQYPMNIGFELSPAADDDIKIQMHEGILQKIEATSDDKTDEIIINISKALSISRSATVAALRNQTEKPALQVSFDPFDENQLRSRNHELMKYGFCVGFAPDLLYQNVVDCGANSAKDNNDSVTQNFVTKINAKHRPTKTNSIRSGLYYRTALPHRLTVFTNNRKVCPRDWCPVFDEDVYFANNGRLIPVDIKRTAFVKMETVIEFDSDGSPKIAHVKKPSELLEASKLPLAVTKAVLSTPGEIFTASTTTINEEKKNIEAQTANLKAKTALINEIKAQQRAGLIQPRSLDYGAILGNTAARSYEVSRNGGSAFRRSTSDAIPNPRASIFALCRNIKLDLGECSRSFPGLAP